jgi:hypothetical protein
LGELLTDFVTSMGDAPSFLQAVLGGQTLANTTRASIQSAQSCLPVEPATNPAPLRRVLRGPPRQSSPSQPARAYFRRGRQSTPRRGQAAPDGADHRAAAGVPPDECVELVGIDRERDVRVRRRPGLWTPALQEQVDLRCILKTDGQVQRTVGGVDLRCAFWPRRQETLTIDLTHQRGA